MTGLPSSGNYLDSTYPEAGADTALLTEPEARHPFQWYAVGDIWALGIAYLATCFIVLPLIFPAEDIFVNFNGSLVADNSLLYGLTCGIIILWLSSRQHYDLNIQSVYAVRDVLNAVLLGAAAHGCLIFLTQSSQHTIDFIILWVMAAIHLLAVRILMRKHIVNNRNHKIPAILVSGSTAPIPQEIRSMLESESQFSYRIVGQINNVQEARLQAGQSWRKLCQSYDAQHVIVVLGEGENISGQPIFSGLARENVEFSLTRALQHVPVTPLMKQQFFNCDLLFMTHCPRLQSPLNRIIKRTLDVVGAFCGLLALSPILLVICFLIKRDGGSAIYKHSRIGLHGKRFGCLKFRSMVVDSDARLKKYLATHPEARKEWEETHKLVDDPRITPIGKFLRSSSLDELPQLINVLMGEMSLVGPRPIVTDETKKYAGDMAYYSRVRPGLTGLWQVSGRSDTSYSQRVSMDKWYVQNWSLWHDIVIIFKTIPALLKRNGAY